MWEAARWRPSRGEDGGTMQHWLARARARIRGNYLVMPHNLTHHRVIEEAREKYYIQ